MHFPLPNFTTIFVEHTSLQCSRIFFRLSWAGHYCCHSSSSASATSSAPRCGAKHDILCGND